ncbi:MAG: site-specific DNA-methyltransferase [Spirochaetes bacterium]|nr:site-specific DNA-methyltransferase [Spirochaetota bacterium]
MASSRNRTLRLGDSDRARLMPRLLESGVGLTPGAAAGRVILGDLLEIAPRLPRASVDLLVADPPYNLRKDFGAASGRKVSDGDYAAYTAAWLDAVTPLLSPAATVYVCGDWRSSAVLHAELSRRFIVRNRITWEREKGRGAARNWKNASEDIWFATVSGTYHFDPGAVKLRRRVMAPYREPDGSPKDWTETTDGGFRDTFPSNLWTDITVPYWSMPENTGHPAQKPEKLVAKLILASTRPGELVFDPFLGSGTTAVVAKKLGRRWLGVEIDPEWALTALRRLELAESNGRIQGFADGIFRERNSGDAGISSLPGT